MILLLKSELSEQDVQDLLQRLQWMGLEGVIGCSQNQFRIGIVGGMNEGLHLDALHKLPEIEAVLPFLHPYKLASRGFKSESTQIKVKDCLVGGDNLAIIAGPCSIESETQIDEIAAFIASKGVRFLRGGAFKPRTSPYDFQGLGKQGLQFMQRAAERYGLVSVSEVMDTQDIELVAEHVDVLQVGARNMQNYSLLKLLGKIKQPVFLKRGCSATYADVLMSAEYILQSGNPNVILCERGIRTFETYTRNTLDLAAIVVLQQLSHLPVVVDPSHGTGRRELVIPMSLAAVTAGAAGLMIEVHPSPDQSISDAKQTISFEMFEVLIERINAL
jgi:3-deoxy-7-phosphoheptulonate synthase